jgi:beta-fructofuranosidase
MAFSLPDHWVWDFWLADSGDLFHMFYLHAPKSLGHGDLRHRNARIGHATSHNLRDWQPHGAVLGPGAPGSFDESATWTGSVIKGPDGLWRMFYTGASFLSPETMTNIESIGLATSPDLYEWTKTPGPVLQPDSRWYETLGTSSWPEEAFRDPWVFADPAGKGWHMLVTARANHGEDAGRGVVGHAVSHDLDHWEARPPLSTPQAGFGHIEVPQLVTIEGQPTLLFCCNAPRLANGLRGRIGGIWSAPALGAFGPFAIERSSLLVDERLYAGRLIEDRSGQWVLLAFNMAEPEGRFVGGICDPLPVRLGPGGLMLVEAFEGVA